MRLHYILTMVDQSIKQMPRQTIANLPLLILCLGIVPSIIKVKRVQTSTKDKLIAILSRDPYGNLE